MLNALRKMLAPAAPGSYHRRWPRIVMTQPARLARQGSSRTALLDNIGGGGACVKVAERLAPGTVVALDFSTGPSDRHSVHARVVHATREERGFNWQCGLCFVDLAPAESRRIADYVEAEGKRREVGFAMPRV